MTFMRLPIVSSHFITSPDATAPFTARPGRIMAFEHSLAISKTHKNIKTHSLTPTFD